MRLNGIKQIHSKKSLLIVKLRSFQNASIEIKQISFVYQLNRFTDKKHTCKMQEENSFTENDFFDSEKKSFNY